VSFGERLCQYGADGLTRAGRDFREIITFYYRGVTTSHMFGR
ncbi:MAG TPA: stage II sporulation protein D, partial [Clostridiales bacterium UBA8153]|nr:stage II sporulation protein D [Clostridiales bacterium UBA8153]